MTDIEYFEYTKVPHDYSLFDSNGHPFAYIHCTEAELDTFVKQVYNSRKSLYKALDKQMPTKLIAHQNYTAKETTFTF